MDDKNSASRFMQMRAVVNFYLTWKCNFLCDHCIHECGPQGNHMTLEQIEYAFRFLQWLKEQNIQVCVFGTTGGEATLHPQLWSEYMPRLVGARNMHVPDAMEMHTNASTPISEENRRMYWKFFSQVIVGHDPCHRKFAKLSELHLQDYTDISHALILRQNSYPIGPYQNVMKLRLKGRAAESIKNGKMMYIPVQEHPKKDCIWSKASGDCVMFDFTPDHINHCGEKSRPLANPDRPEGQFHPYGMDFNDLLHAAFDYKVKYCENNCSQLCMGGFALPV